MSHDKTFKLFIEGDEIIVNNIVNIKKVKLLERGDDLGVYLYEKTGAVIIVRYKNGKMINYDISSAVHKG